MLRIARVEELVYNSQFKVVELDSIRRGQHGDLVGGAYESRVLGAPCSHTDHVILRRMLGVVIDDNLSTDDLSWQPKEQNHEDLVIQEYTKASI